MKNNKNEKEVLFKGKIVRPVFESEDYRVYAVDVDKSIYPDIKLTKYGNATIYGEIHELGREIEYEIKAVEQLTKNGWGYKILNIKRNKPTSIDDMYAFLQEILTFNQAKTLYEVYPDIVDRVMNNNLDDIDLNKLHGIKEYTFNVIKNKIVENFCLAELVIEFQGLLSLSMLKKLYEKYPSINMIKKKFRQDPYKCLCDLARIGFITADNILLELEKASKENIENNKPPIIKFDTDLKTSNHRCLSCMLYLLEKNEEEGHTLMSINDLRNQCIKMVPVCCNHFVECMKHESIFYDKESMVVSLNETYKVEKYIAERIINALIKSKIEWNFDYKKYHIVNGCELSSEQMEIIKNICKYNVCILNGAAGTGKSFVVQAIINMLKNNNKSFKLFSPTGKAAKVLSDYTKEHAMTIHRGLGYIPPDTWTFNDKFKLDCDTLIIDEFSMADIFLFEKVLNAVDFNKTKLLLIGDNAQLPSVSCGNLLHDFMQTNIIPTVTLTKVFRYSEGGLMKVATDVRSCKKYLTNINNQFTWFGENKDYAFINIENDFIVKNAVALYNKLLSQGYKVEDIQLLTSYKKGDIGALAINNAIQKIANPNYGSTEYMKVGDVIYFKGDQIIQNVNNYHANLFLDNNCDWNEEDSKETFIANGETGIVKEVFNNYLIIDFDGTKVKYYRNDMQMVGLGYCITIHKSQGSSIKVVILLTPQSHVYMLNSNLIYVGLTRMKEKCFHLGNISTINQTIKKKANFTRNTFMQNLIKENYKKLVEKEKHEISKIS